MEDEPDDEPTHFGDTMLGAGLGCGFMLLALAVLIWVLNHH